MRNKKIKTIECDNCTYSNPNFSVALATSSCMILLAALKHYHKSYKYSDDFLKRWKTSALVAVQTVGEVGKFVTVVGTTLAVIYQGHGTIVDTVIGYLLAVMCVSFCMALKNELGYGVRKVLRGLYVNQQVRRKFFCLGVVGLTAFVYLHGAFMAWKASPPLMKADYQERMRDRCPGKCNDWTFGYNLYVYSLEGLVFAYINITLAIVGNLLSINRSDRKGSELNCCQRLVRFIIF
jgi:hypothetical protein